MNGKTFSSALLILVFLTTNIHPANSLDVEALLVGYGGERMLPFVDGATLTYFVGEDLELKSIGSSTDVKLIDPTNAEHSYFLEEGEKLKILTFKREDVGVWLLKHHSLGTMIVRVVDNYSYKEGYIIVQKLGDGNFRLLIKGPIFMGFITSNPTNVKIINAPSILSVNIPQGITYARITLEYNETIELDGWIGSVQYRYRTDAIVTEHVYRFNRPTASPLFVDVEIPDIGKVGKGGIIPLRVGTIRLNVVCSGPGTTSYNNIEELLIVPKMVNLPPMTRTIEATLDDLFNQSVKIAYFNASSSKVDVKEIKIPIYESVVFDKALSKFIDDYVLSVDGMVSSKVGHKTYLVPSELQVFRNADKEYVTVNPRLLVYSIDYSPAVKNTSLRSHNVSIITIESKEVLITVRHASGTLIDNAILLINSSMYSVINGSKKIRMPISTYNFSAITEVGQSSLIVDISRTSDVQLIIRSLLPITLAMIIISSFQGALLIHLVIRLVRLKRRLKIN
jgi:hypothetical protein